MKKTLHVKACEYADAFIKQIGVDDYYSKQNGNAELAWNTAYEAFIFQMTKSNNFTRTLKQIQKEAI